MLKITKAKPNPLGKDRSRGLPPPPQQLAGEWIDIQNTTNTGLLMNGVQVFHIAYTSQGSEYELAHQFDFNPNFALPVGMTLRLHSGGYMEVNLMNPVDQQGADYHAFTGKNYIWNNNRPDAPLLWNPYQNAEIDRASYDAPAAEGKILQRNGNKLV